MDGKVYMPPEYEWGVYATPATGVNCDKVFQYFSLNNITGISCVAFLHSDLQISRK